MNDKKKFELPEAIVVYFSDDLTTDYDIMGVSSGDMENPLDPLFPPEH